MRINSKNRKLKFYHLLFFYLGGWQYLTVVFGIGIFGLSSPDLFDAPAKNDFGFHLIVFGILLVIGIFRIFKQHQTIKILKNGILA